MQSYSEFSISSDDEDEYGTIYKMRGVPKTFMACHGCPEDLEFLLKAGADPNFQWKNKDGWRPLHQACGSNELECVEILIKSGAKIEYTDDNGNTPLFVASKYGAVNCIKKLIQLGANINHQNNVGDTSLHVVKHIEVVKLLLDTKCDTSIKNNEGKTALELANERNYLDIANFIQKYNENKS